MMNKRILVTFLWFNVGWTAGAMATFFLGLPDGLSIALAVAFSLAVWFDPLHVLWSVNRNAAVRRSPDLATPTLATE